MTIRELIKLLRKFPEETKVLIYGELGWYHLIDENVEYRKVYLIRHSGYNANNISYEDYRHEPINMSYTYPNGLVETQKTIADEFILSLG